MRDQLPNAKGKMLLLVDGLDMKLSKRVSFFFPFFRCFPIRSASG